MILPLPFRYLATLLFFGGVFTATSSVLADEENMIGMTKREVLKQLGAPIEKKELETKRVSHWKYSKGRSFTFTEDIVTDDSQHASKEKSSDKAIVTAEIALEEVRHIEPIESPTAMKEKGSLPFTGRDVYREFAKLESSDDTAGAPDRPKSRNPVRSRGR